MDYIDFELEDNDSLFLDLEAARTLSDNLKGKKAIQAKDLTPREVWLLSLLRHTRTKAKILNDFIGTQQDVISKLNERIRRIRDEQDKTSYFP